MRLVFSSGDNLWKGLGWRAADLSWPFMSKHHLSVSSAGSPLQSLLGVKGSYCVQRSHCSAGSTSAATLWSTCVIIFKGEIYCMNISVSNFFFYGLVVCSETGADSGCLRGRGENKRAPVACCGAPACIKWWCIYGDTILIIVKLTVHIVRSAFWLFPMSFVFFFFFFF